MLGEILICLPQAKRQAKEYGNTEQRELSFLFVHGLLHLLGYDHMKKEDEEIMFPLQEKILRKAGTAQ
jgi:probable rRNA maturation factor